jgi:hypothetical protein
VAFLALGVELAGVLQLLVANAFLELPELAPKRELFDAEPGEGALLRAQRLVQRLELDVELRLRLGGELGFELLPAFGKRALELGGVALDGLAGNAFGEREAVVALRASHLRFGFDDDGAGHTHLLERNSGSDPGQGRKPADA